MNAHEMPPEENPDALEVLQEPRYRRLFTVVNSGAFLAIISAAIAAGGWYLKSYKECTLSATTLTDGIVDKANKIVTQLTRLKVLSHEYDDVEKIYADAPSLAIIPDDPTLEKLSRSLLLQKSTVDYMQWIPSIVTQQGLPVGPPYVMNLFKKDGSTQKQSIEDLRTAIADTSVFRFLVHYPELKSVYTNQCGPVDMARREYLGETNPLVVGAPRDLLTEDDWKSVALNYRVFDYQ
ncbi:MULTISPECIES: hypothetical protein [unclassified Bradyrhizobium]|uniref:hypothetical protein n=1 Tax=unclassified Bradyrhizobium TaxID=2631580 RepID=UPI001CD3E4E6|nr:MULTISPECIES: hypothetical protein [unclassified Bradyrhizobium]MCA1372185.1 hypothetical protein [Bradyrhizobium sp. IC4060]MCA1482687.1 hypothetical protein [Bradyrhizobium sp. IC4061]MCA1542208.1 hypothetical protein [Bradyrhizobium sp. NBAIM32]